MDRGMTSGIQSETAAQAATETEHERPNALRSVWAFLSGPYPTLVSRLGLGLIFLLSGLTKLGVPGTFQASIDSYEMPLPTEFVRLMAVGLQYLALGLGSWRLLA